MASIFLILVLPFAAHDVSNIFFFMLYMITNIVLHRSKPKLHGIVLLIIAKYSVLFWHFSVVTSPQYAPQSNNKSCLHVYYT